MGQKFGVLFIGMLGNIATTVMAGALGLRKNLFSPRGMVTHLEPFEQLSLLPPEKIVFGGWDIRPGSPLEGAAEFLLKTRLIPGEVFAEIAGELKNLSANLFPGTAVNCGGTISRLAGRESLGGPLKAQMEKLRGDIRKFRLQNGLRDLMVVNLASTEPPLPPHPCHENLAEFRGALDENQTDAIRASTLYAYASLEEGCPYINFTPSDGALIPALIQLANEKGLPVMGNDGKTGESLVKSALAPMFSCRNLEILSWEGFNILGNMDGRVLKDPENKESKIRTKDLMLGKILGYSPHSQVHINYVPSLGDQKTAWDFIHFQGFMGVNMSLQFIWQGYDSILAAPLVLDLVRLTELAKRQGQAGLMPHLASFFKSPLGVQEHRLHEQFQLLLDYIRNA